MEYINNETKEIMTRDEAIDWLKEKIGINFEFTLDQKKVQKQNEVEEILLEAYFWTQKARERVYFDETAGVQVIDLTI